MLDSPNSLYLAHVYHDENNKITDLQLCATTKRQENERPFQAAVRTVFEKIGEMADLTLHFENIDGDFLPLSNITKENENSVLLEQCSTTQPDIDGKPGIDGKRINWYYEHNFYHVRIKGE